MTEPFTLDAAMDFGLETAQRIRTVAPSLTPVLLFWGESLDMGVVSVAQYGEPAMKKPLQEMMSATLKDKQAHLYVFVMEMWFQFGKPGSFEPDYLPSEDPQRKEGIFVLGVTLGGERKAVVVEIKRRKDGGVDFGEKQVMPPAQIAGPLAYLFSHETAH